MAVDIGMTTRIGLWKRWSVAGIVGLSAALLLQRGGYNH